MQRHIIHVQNEVSTWQSSLVLTTTQVPDIMDGTEGILALAIFSYVISPAERKREWREK